MFKTLALIAALALGCFATAKADTISLNGSDTYNLSTTTLDFVGSGSIGGTPTGIFSAFEDCYGCVTLQPNPINYGAGFTPVDLFLISEHTPSGPENLLLTLTSVDSYSGNLEIDGRGTIDINGVFTYGNIVLTTQGGGDGIEGVTFSATTTATPEPESLALFGTGLLGIVGIARRKFSKV